MLIPVADPARSPATTLIFVKGLTSTAPNCFDCPAGTGTAPAGVLNASFVVIMVAPSLWIALHSIIDALGPPGVHRFSLQKVTPITRCPKLFNPCAWEVMMDRNLMGGHSAISLPTLQGIIYGLMFTFLECGAL